MSSRKLGERCGLVVMTVLGLLAILPSGAMGATVIGSTADGSTSITSSACTVSLSSTIPGSLNVANNDTVQTVYNIAWSDTRSANSSDVRSTFTVKVWYPSDSSTYASQTHTQTTTGSSSGATILTVNTAGGAGGGAREGHI